MQAIVIVPTYNERANLAELLEKIQHSAPELHVLIVDDNSPDGTGELADQLQQKDPERIFVLHRAKKEGLGKAYVDGFKQVLKKNYEFILQMDADLSHDPSHLPRFLEQIQNHDLVVGSRYLHGISVVNWDLKRLIMSKLATNYVRFVTRVPFTDTTSGFNCWRRTALESIDFATTFSSGYVFLVEMKYKAYRKGFRVTEVPIIFVERKSGNSKLDWTIIREAIWGVLKLRLKY
ncbi:MAG TPA: dolichyl-phosphate beta-D-mannosyltransferase [Blastocatellia bacterium]|nr:dolichyl-phosphate beta-D-mannosyltransferase [Blastocatellia bacterium]